MVSSFNLRILLAFWMGQFHCVTPSQALELISHLCLCTLIASSTQPSSRDNPNSIHTFSKYFQVKGGGAGGGRHHLSVKSIGSETCKPLNILSWWSDIKECGNRPGVHFSSDFCCYRTIQCNKMLPNIKWIYLNYIFLLIHTTHLFLCAGSRATGHHVCVGVCSGPVVTMEKERDLGIASAHRGHPMNCLWFEGSWQREVQNFCPWAGPYSSRRG